MDKLSMCRICLIKDVPMNCIVNTNLQETYERLTSLPFETKDRRPLQVCCMCCGRLQNCYQLQITCFQSEEFFTQLLENNEFNPKSVADRDSLQLVHSNVKLRIEPMSTNNSDNDSEMGDVKMDPLDMFNEVQVKQECNTDSENTVINMEHNLEFTAINETFKTDGVSVEGVDQVDYTHATEAKYILTSKSAEFSIRDGTQLEYGIYSTESMDKISFGVGTGLNDLNKSTCIPGIRRLAAPHDNSQGSNSWKQDSKISFEQHKNTVNNLIDIEVSVSKKILQNPSKIGGNTLKPYKCNTCEKYFSHQGFLDRHNRLHTDVKQYKCDICGKSFTQHNHLNLHKRSVHSIKKSYKCNTCKKSFIDQSILNVHNCIPSGEKPFKCNVCHKRFHDKNNLTIHIRLHNGEKPFKCDLCPKSFRHKGNLKIHNLIHSGEKPNKCDTCNKIFIHKTNLDNHICINSDKKPYRCDICDKTFSWKGNLSAHFRMHTGEKPFKCNICKKGFTQKINLTNHHRIHTGEKSYKCGVCEKCFTYKNVLKDHMRIHTGEKPYTCETCGQCFRQKTHLNSHVRIHTAVKPHKCDVCDTRFYERNHLRTHIKRVHSTEKPFICNVCNKSFTVKSKLNVHSRIHIN